MYEVAANYQHVAFLWQKLDGGVNQDVFINIDLITIFCNTAFLHLGVGFNVPSAVEAECMLRDTHKKEIISILYLAGQKKGKSTSWIW